MGDSASYPKREQILLNYFDERTFSSYVRKGMFLLDLWMVGQNLRPVDYRAQII